MCVYGYVCGCVCVVCFTSLRETPATAPTVTLTPTWWGCRCARPSGAASRLQRRQISHRLRNYVSTAHGTHGDIRKKNKRRGRMRWGGDKQIHTDEASFPCHVQPDKHLSWRRLWHFCPNCHAYSITSWRTAFQSNSYQKLKALQSLTQEFWDWLGGDMGGDHASWEHTLHHPLWEKGHL